jgi:hypothetical protein
MAEKDVTKKVTGMIKEADKVVQGVGRIIAGAKELRDMWRGFRGRKQEQ